MNKGYAFGFLIVLLVLILGLYVAYTGFVSGRETQRAQPTSVASTRLVRVPGNPTTPASLISATLALSPTLTPEVSATLVAVPELVVTEPPPPTNPPVSNPTELPPTQPTATAAAETQPPTPVPAPAHQFRLGGPPVADPDYSICCYIYGTVRDAAGNGLEGVQVQASNEWNPPLIAVTKGGGEAGKYDIPINAAVVNWEIILVDGAGNPISTKVQVKFDANAANGHRVDWQRTY